MNIALQHETAMWNAAVDCDRDAFLQQVAEDAMMVCGGHRCSGAEYAWLICDVGIGSYKISEYEVIHQSDTLIQVHYIVSATAKREEDADLAGLFHVTSTWQKREEGWKLIFNMDSRIVLRT